MNHVVYSDTGGLPPEADKPLYLDAIELRPHKPIGIEVHQTSYTWAAKYAKRFAIIDFQIRNVTSRPINEVCLGFFVQSNANWLPEGVGYSVWPPVSTSPEVLPLDDMAGFIDVAPGIIEGTEDTVNMVWSSDNDGDPFGRGIFTHASPTGVMGVRILRAPSRQLSFNWWAIEYGTGFRLNWGPRRTDHRLGYYGSRGTPLGDRARYKLMTNGEIDYDVVYAGSPLPSLQGWSQDLHAELARDVADGHDISYILSVGPMDEILPGDSVSFTVAVVMGADLHTDPSDFQRHFSAADPKPFLDRLNFSDLLENARWADWVFDNPGYDTDGDGDRGAAYLMNCEQGKCDSIFYRGDGVPDFRGPHPPTPPTFTVTSTPGRVMLNWDGSRTETEIDNLTGKRDFEGYRVYLGRFDRDDQYSLLSSWDKVDYKRFSYDSSVGEWTQSSDPLTAGEWKAVLKDTQFDPTEYAIPSLETAYRDTAVDTILNRFGEVIRVDSTSRSSFWLGEGFNHENEFVQDGILETNLIQLTETRDTIIGDDTLSFGVYEAVIERLNPAVPLYFAITTLDYGDYTIGLESLASFPSNNSGYAQPIYPSDVVIDSGLRVSVYPNPYKISFTDGRGNRTTYFQEGYEARGVVQFTEQDRRIHFVNLPDTATIRIYSLDGDLVRTIHHPDPFLTTYSSSVGWDLVTRNAQAVVSGIYIWRVDSRLGSQMGKLVVIK